MLRILPPFSVAVVVLLAFGQIAFAAGAVTDDEFFGLPEDVGRDEVIAYCGACHSVKLVVQQGLTSAGWSELLVWMYEEQGMDKLEASDEKLVLDYLSKHVDPASHKARLRQRGILR